MRATAISVIGSGASFVAGVAVPIAFPHVDPWVGKWLLVLAVALGALAFGLWFPHRRGGGEGGTAVTTHGPHSPGFGTVHGDVNITHAPHELPKESAYDWNNVDALTRIRFGGTGTRERAERLAAMHSVHEGLRTPALPDLPLNGLLVRLVRKHGKPPADNLARGKYWLKVDKEIADTVSIHKLHVWGRVGNRPIGQIGDDIWATGEFNHVRQSLVQTNAAGTVEFKDLHFNKAEVERHWPEPTKEGK